MALSYLAFVKGFSPTPANLAGAAGVTVVANLGSFVSKDDKGTLSFVEFLSFVKDGFLWTSAYPTLATALSVAAVAPKG